MKQPHWSSCRMENDVVAIAATLVVYQRWREQNGLPIDFFSIFGD
jgi:hypothetical protein